MKNILTQQEINHINQLCRQYNIENYTINSGGYIDVDADVNLSYEDLDKLPLKFGKVGGNFSCYSNHLTSLEGCPGSVGGNFSCGSNRLTFLEGCPGSVGGNFSCGSNELTSLEFSPTSVGGDFHCTRNHLTSLEGCPSSVGGDFECYHNQLTSLKFSPIKIGGDFICDNNHLPDHFMDVYQNLNDDEKKIFFKYQDDLRIWQGEYNEEEAHVLYEEIKDGMR